MIQREIKNTLHESAHPIVDTFTHLHNLSTILESPESNPDLIKSLTLTMLKDGLNAENPADIKKYVSQEIEKIHNNFFSLIDKAFDQTNFMYHNEIIDAMDTFHGEVHHIVSLKNKQLLVDSIAYAQNRLEENLSEAA